MTKPLETSTWEAMKVCAGAGKALLVVSGVAAWSMVWPLVSLLWRSCWSC